MSEVRFFASLLYFPYYRDMQLDSASLLLARGLSPYKKRKTTFIAGKLPKMLFFFFCMSRCLRVKKAPVSRNLKNKKSARRDSNPRPSPWQGDTPPLSHSRIFAFLSFVVHRTKGTILYFLIFVNTIFYFSFLFFQQNSISPAIHNLDYYASIFFTHFT